MKNILFLSFILILSCNNSVNKKINFKELNANKVLNEFKSIEYELNNKNKTFYYFGIQDTFHINKKLENPKLYKWIEKYGGYIIIRDSNLIVRFSEIYDEEQYVIESFLYKPKNINEIFDKKVYAIVLDSQLLEKKWIYIKLKYKIDD